MPVPLQLVTSERAASLTVVTSEAGEAERVYLRSGLLVDRAEYARPVRDTQLGWNSCDAILCALEDELTPKRRRMYFFRVRVRLFIAKQGV